MSGALKMCRSSLRRGDVCREWRNREGREEGGGVNLAAVAQLDAEGSWMLGLWALSSRQGAPGSSCAGQ